MRGKRHSDEVRAAVMAALLSGQTVSQVASEYQLSKSVVGTWKKAQHEDRSNNVRTKNYENIEALLIDYVATNLRTLKAQSIEAGRPEYVQKQPASELAVLHGVIADKTVRILGALEPSEIPAEGISEASEARIN